MKKEESDKKNAKGGRSHPDCQTTHIKQDVYEGRRLMNY
jgi:hypothetical protein